MFTHMFDPHLRLTLSKSQLCYEVAFQAGSDSSNREMAPEVLILPIGVKIQFRPNSIKHLEDAVARYRHT
jgi:hypothetical protein